MKVYKVQAPDGTILQIEGPAGATNEQLIQAAQAAFAARTDGVSKASAPQEKFDPTEGMSGTEKFLAGVGKSMVDVGRGVRQYLPQAIGGLTGEEIAQARELDKPLMQTGAGMAGNLAGNVAMAIPAAFVPGANTLTGSAAIGAAYGAMQPGVDVSERLKNTAIGGVAGAVVPAAQTAYRVGKSMVDPLYQGGREQILGRALRQTAGGQADEAMRNLRTAQELVPGSAPTAGQAAGVPSIAALERAAMAANPNATNQLVARQRAQNEARINAIQGMVPDRAAAVAARDQAATSLYNAANPRPVQVTPVLADLMQRPAMQTAMQRAQTLAQNNGEVFDPNNLTGQGAHYIKMALDDLTNAGPAAGIGGNEIRALEGIRTSFLRELESQIPEYGQARQAYAQMSRPVTQADVLGQVADRATNFRGNLTPAAFESATSDQTARAVTGQARSTMANVLDPQQAQTLNNVMADLLRADFANTAGRGAGSDTVQKLAYQNMLTQSGMPSAISGLAPMGVIGNLAQKAGQVVYRDANERLQQQLAEALLDPRQTAALMEAGMVTPQMQAMIEGLRRGGASVGAAAPMLVQANQQ